MVEYQPTRLNEVFSALADASRRAIVQGLLDGEKSLMELAKPFKISLPAVMKHVAVLESSGLVRSEKRGRARYCSLNLEPLEEAQSWLQETRTFWNVRLTRLDQYLREEK